MYISICIPTYNSGEKLEKLLDSVKLQTFIDYEIVISDDSRNENVKNIIEKKYGDLNIKYYHNEQALGTPNNWNNAVEKASGEWIKLMHHDDWFYQDSSLQEFVNATKINPNSKLIFCAFKNNYLDKNSTENFYCSPYEIFLLKNNYLNLFKTFMGNPSCTLINNQLKPYYDPQFKWLIDFDFYTDFFSRNKNFTYINKILVCLGMHSGQVTASVFQNASVEIPESISLLDKHGIRILKNIYVYDFYWRLYRNIHIRSIEQFNKYLGKECTYENIKKMIKAQQGVRISILKIGLLSKLLMFISFVKNYFS